MEHFAVMYTPTQLAFRVVCAIMACHMTEQNATIGGKASLPTIVTSNATRL